MTVFQKTRSTIRPEPIKTDDYSVWIADNVREIKVDNGGLDESKTSAQHTEYEYDLIQYTKDEYIRLISDKSAALETDILDTQAAVIELAQIIGG